MVRVLFAPSGHSFRLDYTTQNFGESVAMETAKILNAVDSFNFPRPVNWINGPGG